MKKNRKNKDVIANVIAERAHGYFSYKPLPLVVGVDVTLEQSQAIDFFFENENSKDKKKRNFFYCMGGARRAGKTEVMSRVILIMEERQRIGDFFLGAMDIEKVKSLYWNRIMALSKRYGYGFVENKSSNMIITPANNRIFFKSIRDKRVIEWARGEKFKFALVDEAQTAVDDNLYELIEYSLGPAMSDLGGKIVLAGTPPPVHKGIWYEWRIKDTPGVKKFVLDYKKNNFIDPELREAYLDQIRARRGLEKGKEDAKFKNEYFDACIEDFESLIFRYNEEKNGFSSINIPLADRRYVIGYDIGYDDADAICVLCYSLHHKEVYLIEEHVGTKQTLEEPAAVLMAMRTKYANAPIIVDTGGLGKKIGQDLMHRYKLNIIPAEKSEKGGWIHTMRDSLHRGDLKIKPKSHAVQEMRLVQWAEKQDAFDPKGYHPDLLDALLYSYRNIHNYVNLKKETVVIESMLEAKKRRMRLAAEKSGQKQEPSEDSYKHKHTEKYGRFCA